ncbi:TPA: type VI secretion system Vgr family protein [Salmonella enterica]
MSLKGLRFTLEVDGQSSTIFVVVSFRLVQKYSLPFMLEVDVASDSFRQHAEELLEKNATLTLWQGAQALRRISGVISTFGMKEHDGWQMQYRFRIQPPLWRCALRQNFRIFQLQDIQAISDTLLRESGITTWTPCFYEDHPAREFCVQYGESDLAFLTRLWSEEGIFFFDRFSPEGADQKMTLCDNVAGLSRLPASIVFNPNTTTEVTTECISQFRYEATVSPSSVTSQDYTFKVPDWPGYYEQEADSLNGQWAQYEIFDYPGRFKDEQHGEDFTRYKIEGWRSGAETALCVSNSPRLWPGIRFTLSDHPIPALNRNWQVVSSTLVGVQPQARHGSAGQGTLLTNQFSVIPAEQTWRPRPLPKPRVDGPQSAVVTGPAGEEIFCDEYGRVRLKFLWDRYHGGTEDSSCWIRVSQAWAGAGFGHLAIPRVGQEVIVDFLNGDPDQPIVTGRAYHEDNPSPGDLPATRTKMTIRSKTYQGDGFNELTFEDATDQEQVYIHAQKNMDTEVLNNRTTDVKVDHSETIGNNQSITVGLGQTVTVGKENAGGHDQKITVAHDRHVTVGNDQRITVQHDHTQEVTNDRTVCIGHDTSLSVVRNRCVSVEGKQEHRTTKDHISQVGGKHSLEVKGDMAQKVAGALGIRVEGDIVLQSDSKISLKVGGSFVVIHAGGVDIGGPKINLNSGGSPGNAIRPLQLTNQDSDKYHLQFHFFDKEQAPYSNIRYIAYFVDGTQIYGETDQNGYTEIFTQDNDEEIAIKLINPDFDTCWGEEE